MVRGTSTTANIRRQPRLDRASGAGDVCGLALVGMAAGLLSACDARFIDLRPISERSGSPSVPPNGAPDGGNLPGDLGEASDGATLPSEVRVAAGRFEGRAGHGGSGGAGLYRLGGAYELRFDADFTVSAVPGPAIFLTSRADMGGSIDALADIKLGTLSAFNGAQRFAIPTGADVGRRNVFVYCQPFRVEVAKAALVEVAQ